MGVWLLQGRRYTRVSRLNSQFDWFVLTFVFSVAMNSYFIAPAIWGSSGSTIGRIGVICHELAHFLGVPDLVR